MRLIYRERKKSIHRKTVFNQSLASKYHLVCRINAIKFSFIYNLNLARKYFDINNELHMKQISPY